MGQKINYPIAIIIQAILCCCLFIVLETSVSEGAEITPKSANQTCEFNFSGVIEKGDLEKLKKAQKVLFRTYVDDGTESADIRHICLDSPGGAINEAIKIADYFYTSGLGTYISEKKSCLSACAFIFMMGTAYGGEYNHLNRTMHATATLGFHRPDLQLPELTGLSDKEMKSAFNIAVDVISKLTQLSIRYIPETLRPIIKADLIHQVFEHKGDNFFYIDTVEKAGRWEISVDGIVPKIDVLTPKIAADICTNLYTWKIKNFGGILEEWEIFQSDELYILEAKDGNVVYAWNQQGVRLTDGMCSVIGRDFGDYFSIDVCSSGHAIVDTFTGRNCAEGEKHIPGIGLLNMDLIVFPGQQKLAQLADKDFVDQRKVTENKHRFDVSCLVISNDIIIDSETCSVERRQNWKGGDITYYFWPSGSKTVIELNFEGTQYQINGSSAQSIKTTKYRECWINNSTSNYFCVN